MDYNDLLKQYENVPNELKVLKRWVCFILDEEKGKVPINPINGKRAKANDQLTWSNFNLAIGGCVKYNCQGLGFMLGNGIFGVDLDDGAYKKLKKGEINEEQYKYLREDFDNLIKEFTNELNSYTEYSVSKKGVHILCYGKLPEGRRRNGDIEMYDSARFFAMTGNVINNVPIQNRENEIIDIWKKYIDDGKAQSQRMALENYVKPEFELEDERLIELILKSPQKGKFEALMEGDLSSYNDDHSAADQAFCNILAFWTNKNIEQMDRIFRNSALYREKWDQKRGEFTYGEKTLNYAISITDETFEYKPNYGVTNELPSKPSISKAQYLNEETGELMDETNAHMNIDRCGNPIFRRKQIFKSYHLDDTGNANRFYDYFGELFKYNTTDKIFMFWTGKTWIRDEKEFIKKYANELIEIMRDDIPRIEDEIKNKRNIGEINEADMLEEFLKNYRKNLTRISNKAGKEAMISEFKALKNISVGSDEFNKDIYLLNTEDGIIDLTTGKLLPFDPNKMISKNTNCKVSFDTPNVWIAFLESIFYRGDDDKSKQETKDIIEFVRLALGYTLSGSCKEQGLFLLYGGGSNGKSTFTEQIAHMLGDYADSVKSSILMQQKMPNNSATFSIAKLKNIRFVGTGETDEGGKLAEGEIKSLTGGDTINAQFKYANEFSYKPEFKIWMSTNNKPIIRGTDFGIWRRIFPIPFMRQFTKEEKDRDMPDKLKSETSQILGWCIKGFLDYMKKGCLELPHCLEAEREDYKDQMDVVAQFLKKECIRDDDCMVAADRLYKSYKIWARDNEEYVVRQSKFEEELLVRRVKMIKGADGIIYYNNLRLLRDRTNTGFGYEGD